MNTVQKFLTLPVEVDQEIASLAERKATSASDIMCRVFALYLHAAEMEKQGMTLGFSRDKSKLDIVVTGL